MTKAECIKFLAIVNMAYPNWQVNELTVGLWAEMLEDIDFKIAQIALKKHIAENPYPPTIADIRKAVAEITTPKENKLTAAEAWGEVMAAVRQFGYYREAEALASMSERTRRVVKYIGWQNICTCEEIDVLRGQFRAMYEQLEEREKKEAILPPSVHDAIKALAEAKEIDRGFKMIEGGKR
ncbi:conserved hypothetical protein [Caldicellulosiruptor hydrothermalis 108]|uniref:Uncharacterized protein n=1 Tax=Caldicellulosiruptor hydrothermalis (strain DSM 18901 / VKM B-2411 / 108) TaxID=632292 RepID=E4QDS2_CALH1|nr:replicative helicase loader/inhibitor [Caldicellulosiruptor hydrothermalis]ADQ06489.1 conserved hypothetical protein [Caldicellulosiruptor hydrothermalis 108]